ncbi:hypothetical protein [Pontibacter sp. SGAir0037]|uniref:hypothetical protein n=1 Tax=Pontibacter sp. SGAir0037 TaxID=2571030 RepID=UPI0010CCD74F|nr:hypothetical protein [Pontibacter sp. SGAir0037]QCR24013.1 hypothetical protein C1N53_17745 [Pontibacter sp. SGAir0037]
MNITTKMLAAMALLLSLQSCTDQIYTTDPYRTPNARLTSLMLPPHKKDVELFFKGETPEEEYIKIAAIEARGPEDTSYGSLIKHLQLSAQKFGADAILVMDKNYKSNTSNWTYNSRNISTDNYPELHGIAIKYRKNIDLTQIPKEQEIHFYNQETSSFEPALHLKLTYGGGVEEKEELNPLGMQHYTNFIKNYSLQHLMYEDNKNWKSREVDGKITHRQLTKQGLPVKQVQFIYNPDGSVAEIQLQHYHEGYNTDSYAEKILISYNEEGKVKERTIFRSDNPYLREVYHYDQSSSRLDVMETYIVNQEKDTPFIKTAFAYYDPEEVK